MIILENFDATILGSEFNDELVSEAIDTEFEGNTGDDVLLGGAGDDVLDGGDGADTLAGGAGSNTFFPGLGEDRIEIESEHDRIVGTIQELDGDTIVGARAGLLVEIEFDDGVVRQVDTADIEIDTAELHIDTDKDGAPNITFGLEAGHSIEMLVADYVESRETINGPAITTARLGFPFGYSIEQSLTSGGAAAGQALFGEVSASGQAMETGPTGLTLAV